MSAPTMRALPGPKARRRVRVDGPRPDLMWLLWLTLPAGLACLSLRPLIGGWGLVPATVVVAAIVAVIAWSTGGEP